MTVEAEKFKVLTDEADSILITSHISPDPDAVCSLLLLGTTLKANYPDKDINMVMEEQTDGLEFLEGYADIQFKLLDEALVSSRPDLVVLLDGQPKYERFSRHGGPAIRTYLQQSPDTKVAVIDHHEPLVVDKIDAFINQGSVAAVQEVYELLFDTLKLKKPAGFAFTAMLGLYSDSGGLIYDNHRQKQMLTMVSELLEAGVSLEEVNGKLNHYTADHLVVLKELLSNLSHEQNYNYSFISDDLVKKWQADGKDPRKMFTAYGQFSDQYIRNIEDRKWGFLVRPDVVEGPGNYSVSLRSQSGVVDVSKIAAQLGGGGHIPAAGARFKAATMDEAVRMVKQAISKTLKA